MSLDALHPPGSDEQPRDSRTGRFMQRLADDAAAAAEQLEDPELARARAALNEEFREAVSGERRKKVKRPHPDAPREEWEAYIEAEYGPAPEVRDPMRPGAANAGDRGPEREPSFSEVMNERIRELRLGPRRDVEVIRLK